MTATLPAEAPVRSVLFDMADKYGVEPKALEATLRNTVIRPDRDGREATREEFAAFLLVAKQYDLNPLTREIYAFADKGRIIPVVSVDGWSNIINSHPQFDGLDFQDTFDAKGKIVASTCRIHRKDRGHPIQVTEYLAECERGTEPWKKWPARMLRHKSLIQCARYAFGFAGIYDQDEAERIASAGARDVTPRTASLVERLKGQSSPGFSLPHVEQGIAAVSAVTETEDVVAATTLPDTSSLPQAEAPEVTEEASVTEAYIAGREARRQGINPRAVPDGYDDYDKADWKAGWSEQDAEMKGGA